MKRHRGICELWKNRDKKQVTNERIINTFEKRYGSGVTNAIHIPDARRKKEETNLKKYGAINTFCKDSILYDQIQSYWNGKDRSAHLDKNNWARPEVKAKIKESNLRKYGVTNPSLHPEIRAKQLATSKERYGDEQTLRVPEIRAKGINTMIEKYGVPNAMKLEEIQNKVKGTNLENYGVEWTTQDMNTRLKQYESQINHYGSYYFQTTEAKKIIKDKFPESLDKFHATNIERYGVPHPMQNPEYARNQLQHSRRSGPNNLEKKFQSIFPQFLFTGDGSYWRYLPALSKNKNPDFLLIGPEPENPFHGANSIVEIFGDYWHSERFTGLNNEDHESLTIAAWNEIGMNCLVIWENEFKTNNWKSKVKYYLNRIKISNSVPVGVKRNPSLINQDLVDFSFSDIKISRLSSFDDAKKFLDDYHYSGYGRAGSVNYGVYLGTDLLAVVKFASPVRQGIAATLKIESKQLLELDRFCIHPSRHKKNFASFIMARVIRLIKRDFPIIRKLVSFADPRAGHTGHIYKASNWTDLGKTAPSYYYLDPNGNEVNKKTLYQSAKRQGLIEREYFESLGYKKVQTPAKFKYSYTL